MDLSKIITITGRGGLFRVVAQGRQAIIAESLADGKRLPVHASIKVSTLEEIHMFTKGDDVPLKDVLTKLHGLNKGKATVDPKGDDKTLFAKLKEVLPDYDPERIYASDVRKLFLWYGQLLKAGILAEKEKTKPAEKSGPKASERATASKGKGVSAGTKKATTTRPSNNQGKTKAAPMRKGGQRGS
jgi:Domain of unknown function (DUF5606)